MMSIFLQLTVNGLIAGSIYALVASGFALIYGANKLMHFAHGACVVLAGYLFYAAVVLAKFPIYLAIIPTIFVSALFGFFVRQTVYSPLQKRNASNVMLLVASIAVLILIQNVIQAIFGAQVKSIHYDFENSISFFGATINSLQLYIILVTCFVFAGLFFLMEKTKIGKEMRALFENKDLSSIVGINTEFVSKTSFVIGSALAGLVGVFIILDQNITPAAGTNLIVRGFTAAVIGGVTNVPASILGGFVLGLAENYGIWFLPSGFKEAIAFALLFVFLLFRSNGLFGIDRRLR